jgi:WD40 repeat protein
MNRPSRGSRVWVRHVLAASLLAVLSGSASAQYTYFGKSKVQTRGYDFQNYETEHFRILFYPGGETMAEFAARSAEAYYSGLAGDLGFDLDYKVPLILYLSPGQFAETNVVTDVIEEGVGGFSELFKNRIVIPFNGSYNDLHHVIGHELTHIFEFQMFYRSQLSALLGAVSEFEVPLWVMEGFAEFQSGWVNVTTESFMRDLLLNDRLVPLQDLHDGMGYFVYREGEAFFLYVAETYGRKKVYEFLQALRVKRNMDAAFRSAFGMDVEEFDGRWQKWLRARYWPDVGRVVRFDRIAQRLTNHRKDGSVYNTAPAISPSGTKIAMVSDRKEYVDCYVLSSMDGRILKRLVRGGRSGGFENMHIIRPGVAWSPDEKTVAIVTTTSGRDNIALIEFPRSRVRRRLATGLDAVYSPKFSPDGKSLVFVGLKNGFSDIYTVSIDGGEPRRVTYDMYEERDPEFSPGGDTIVYVSDRPDPGEDWRPGEQAVWLQPLTGSADRLTERGGELGYPVFTHDSRYLLYVAADSARNIQVYSFEEKRVVRRSDFAGEVSYVGLSRDDRKLTFAYFDDVGWDIVLILDPLDVIPETEVGEGYRAPGDTAVFAREGLDHDSIRPLRFNLSADYAVGSASYTSGSYGGLTGLLYVSLSDMLGNHRFGIYTNIYGDILNSDLMLQYWLQPFRIDYGFTFFQWRDVLAYVPLLYYRERVQRGGQAVAVYPFDKFTRVEVNLTGYWSQEAAWMYDSASNIWRSVGSWDDRVFYGGPAFVFDNTYWTWQGPARGTRTRFGVDATIPTLSARQFLSASWDFRNYQRLGRRFVFASRLLGIGGMGSDAAQYYIGGELVRGYRWGEFYADSLTGPGLLLGGVELRYPFLDRLDLAFPLPISFGGIRGVAFLDGGLVVRDGMRLWKPDLDKAAGEWSHLDDLKLGTGVGIRIYISYFSLMFDWAYPLSAAEHKGWKFDFRLGTDF